MNYGTCWCFIDRQRTYLGPIFITGLAKPQLANFLLADTCICTVYTADYRPPYGTVPYSRSYINKPLQEYLLTRYRYLPTGIWKLFSHSFLPVTTEPTAQFTRRYRYVGRVGKVQYGR